MNCVWVMVNKTINCRFVKEPVSAGFCGTVGVIWPRKKLNSLLLNFCKIGVKIANEKSQFSSPEVFPIKIVYLKRFSVRMVLKYGYPDAAGLDRINQQSGKPACE